MPSRPPFVTKPFPAKFPYICPGCDFAQEPGNPSRLVDGDIHCESCGAEIREDNAPPMTEGW